MPETLRRRNRLSDAQTRLVVAVAAGSGVLGAFAGCHPTQTSIVDPVLTGAVAALVAWAGATSVWWAAGTGGAVIAVCQPTSWHLWVALAVVLTMCGVGALRLSAAGARALAAAGVAQAALRLDLRHPFGLSALIGGLAMGVIVVSGIRRRSSETRRIVRVTAVGLSAVAGAALLLALVTGLAARSSITKGVDSATKGLRFMRAGDPSAASEALAQSATSLSSARSLVKSPLLWPAKLIPGLSQHVHTAERLVTAGRDTARVVSGAVSGVDVRSVKVRAGVVDLSAIDRLQLPLETTRDAVVLLDEAVNKSRTGWLIDPLNSRLRRLAQETAKASLQGRNAVEAARLAPSLLGADSKRVWLVLFTTPAEARGLGGFPGNWAEITTERGRITVTRKGTVVSLINGGPNKKGRIVHAPQDYLDRYGKYGAGINGAPMRPIFWNNITLSPDGPTVAEIAADLYAQSGGQPVDGVIVADPYALQAIVSLTGPLTLSSDGTDEPPVLTPSNIVHFLLVDQYQRYAGSTSSRKDALQEASDLAVKTLLSKDLPSPVTIARAFGKPLATGHLMFWSLNPKDQAPIRALGISGTLPQPVSDGFSYTLNNSGPNKMDTFVNRSLEYRAKVNERTGSVTATATIRIKNNATEAVALPDDVTGNYRGAPRGSIQSLLSVYSPLQLFSASIDGRTVAFGDDRLFERGWRVYDSQITVPPGKELVIELRFVGKVNVTQGYSWLTKPQPLVAPNNVTVDIRFKHGKRSIRYSGPLDVTTPLT